MCRAVYYLKCRTVFFSCDQLEELECATNEFLLELVGRNTAPAIALVYMALEKDEDAYVTVLQKARKLEEENNLVTFGIKPKFAEQGLDTLKRMMKM